MEVQLGIKSMKIFNNVEIGNCFRKIKEIDKVKERMGGCSLRWVFLSF